MSEQVKRGRGRPRKNPIAKEKKVRGRPRKVVTDDEPVIINTKSKDGVCREITQETELTGSCRFGYLYYRPDVLCMLIGPIPNAYPIITCDRKDIKMLARKAQKIMEDIYATKENRPKTFQGVAALVKERLLNET